MATVSIQGRKVKVDDAFLSLPPEEQAQQVDEIAEQLGITADTGALPEQGPMPEARPTEQDQSYLGAATTWLDHAIGDIPIAGPAFKTASDYLGSYMMAPFDDRTAEQIREDTWASRAKRDEMYPASAVSGGLGGNIAAFGAAGTVPTVARSLGIEGASLAGRVFNSARSGFAINSSDALARGKGLDEATGSGVIGAGISAAFPAGGELIRRGAKAAGEAFGPIVNSLRNPTGEAERRLGSGPIDLK